MVKGNSPSSGIGIPSLIGFLFIFLTKYKKSEDISNERIKRAFRRCSETD
jgi:uncharacterized membrane protein